MAANFPCAKDKVNAAEFNHESEVPNPGHLAPRICSAGTFDNGPQLKPRTVINTSLRDYATKKTIGNWRHFRNSHISTVRITLISRQVASGK